MFIIEILGDGVTVCTMDGESIIGSEFESDLDDCVASGDAEPACAYVRDVLKPEIRTVARTDAGTYENRLATAAEKAATCRAVYFESDADFADESVCDLYLIWDAAVSLEGERERERQD